MKKKIPVRLLFWSAAVCALLLAAWLGPHFLVHDPYLVDLSQVNAAPSASYLMGTDSLGRCIACRLVEGAARSIFSALLVVLLSFLLGTTAGLLCGYLGGVVDALFMRLVDGVQAFPSLVLTVAIAGMLGSGAGNCIIALTVGGWCSYARIARSQVLALRERTFVRAAMIFGYTRGETLVGTILPNCMGPLIVTASMHVGNTILSFAGLSYLGLGTSPPYPEWGTMLSEGQSIMQRAPWAVIFPGLAIVLVVMIMGMFGDSLNEALSPETRS